MIHLSRPILGAAEEEAVLRVLRSGMLAQGSEVALFEAEFGAYVGEGIESVAVNNGTAAIVLPLMALGIGVGDEVILPSFTFIASANAVRAVGATPVFCDVEATSFCIDPADAASRITRRTRAIIAVHLYGHPARLDLLQEVCAREGIHLLEDSAQAHGAVLHGRRVGNVLGTFSFYPTKNMTTGEGGMVTTPDPELADRMRLIRNHGMRRQYEFETFGLNLRLTDLAAAIGRVQLGHLESRNQARRRNAAVLSASIHRRDVITPTIDAGVEHVFHQYTVRSADRDTLRAHLHERGVASGVYYPTPCHRTAIHRTDARLPVTDELCQTVLSLPIRPDLTDADLAAIVEAVETAPVGAAL